MFYINYIAHHYRSSGSAYPVTRAQQFDAEVGQSPDSAMAYSVAYSYANPPVGTEELKPTYEHLFPEAKGILVCDPESIKAQTSPVAYLVALYQFVKNLGETEETVAKPIKELFEQRRPDIEPLCLDEKAQELLLENVEVRSPIILSTSTDPTISYISPKNIMWHFSLEENHLGVTEGLYTGEGEVTFPLYNRMRINALQYIPKEQAYQNNPGRFGTAHRYIIRQLCCPGRGFSG